MKGNFLKRSLSLFLAVLTIFSCLLFISPEVSAADKPGVECNDWRGWANDDPRWFSVTMNKGPATLGSAGCAVISYTKLLIKNNIVPSTYLPTELNKWMISNNGYTKDKGKAFAAWENLANFDPRITHIETRSLTGSVDARQAAIMSEIKKGHQLLVGVNGGWHWVYVNNEASIKKNKPLVFDTCYGCSDPATYNVNRDLFSSYTGGNKPCKLIIYDVKNVSYTLRYMANGGTGKMADTKVQYGVEKPSSPNAFTRKGYAFAGWNIYRTSDGKWYCQNKSGKTGWYSPNAIPKGYTKVLYKEGHHFAYASKKQGETFSLYAVWTPAYTVQYKPNGGKGSMANDYAAVNGAFQLDANTFTRSGHVFSGWTLKRTSDNKWYYKNSKGTGKWYTEGKQAKGYTKAVFKDRVSISKLATKAGQTLQFYAKWDPYYTVKYNANGGKGTMADTRVMIGKDTKTTKNQFTREGYTFAGWNVYRASDKKWYYEDLLENRKWLTEKQASLLWQKTVYKNGTTVANTSSVPGDTVTFYAVWQKKPASSKPEPASTLCVKNAILPPAKLAAKSAFTISGTVTSNYNITSVTASVVNKSTGKTMFSATATPNAKSYSLYNLDAKMAFSKLAAGSYTILVTATDTKGTKTLIKQDFTTANATFSTSSLVYPSGTLTKGKTFKVSGKVTANAKIKNVELSVHTTDGVKKFSASAAPKVKTYDIYKLDSKMTFKSLPAGKYIFRVKVTDNNNVSKYLVSMSFTVK